MRANSSNAADILHGGVVLSQLHMCTFPQCHAICTLSKLHSFSASEIYLSYLLRANRVHLPNGGAGLMT